MKYVKNKNYYLAILALGLVCVDQAFASQHTTHAVNKARQYRRTTSRPDGSDIVYYFTIPENAQKSYPIALFVDGSSVKGNLKSVWHNYVGFASDFWPLGIATIGLEKWGIDCDSIDEQLFYEHYTWSQRYTDHQTVINMLIQNPPPGWNGKFILLGVSEGGPIVNRLACWSHDVIATINWCGAGDWMWKEEVWDYINHEWSLRWNQMSWWEKVQMRFRAKTPPSWTWHVLSSDFNHASTWGKLHCLAHAVIIRLPTEWRDVYEKIIQDIQANPQSTELWFEGHTYKYMADALGWNPAVYNGLKSPLLVVMGTMDPCIRSFDDFVRKAKDANALVTVMRIEGMGHDICDPRFTVIKDTMDWVKKFL